jgi:cytochrome c-type biogenesis protein CcsB
VKFVYKALPFFFVALFGAELVAIFAPKKDGEFHLREFGRLPVLANGRIQPFDSFARNSLLQLRSTGDLPLEEVPAWKFWHHPKKLKATEWLLEVMTRPEVADTRPAFLISHSDLLGELKIQDKGIEKSGLRYYTFDELRSVGDEILEQGRKASAVREEERSSFQKQVLKLANAVNLYGRLKYTLQPEGEDNWAGQVKDFWNNLGPARVAARASEEKKEFDRDALERIAKPVRLFDQMANFGEGLIIPPHGQGASRDDWKNTGTALMESARSDSIHPAAACYAGMATAYRQDNAAEFNRAIDDYKAWLVDHRFDRELNKGRAEFFYNDIKIFLHATIIYIFAFILGGLCLLTITGFPAASESFRRSGFYLICLAGAAHTFGLIFRMILEGRPPVTNLYSSAIFIGWGALVLGLVIERIYRLGIGIIVASFAGFVTLLIAHNLALGGDTMEMLRAVLDTNFWLATHVVVVTLGYASTFFAGLLAIIYIFLGLFTRLLPQKLTPHSAAALSVVAGAGGGLHAGIKAAKNLAPEVGRLEIGKALTKMVYAIICFATLFSFTGTVLGGIWADQSWGRFWGWDPKENGALMIVIWNALILHARWGGLVKDRGLMNLAVFGNIATSFSWFGVNMLGIGLHSYGFMDAAFKWLMLFVVTQLLLIGDGSLPSSCWKSFSIGSSPRAAAFKWVTIALNVLIMTVGFFAGFNSPWIVVCMIAFFGFVIMARFSMRDRASGTQPPAVSIPERTAPAPA